MTSRASRRRYPSSVRPKWWARSGHLYWTHCWIPLRLAEKIYELVRLVIMPISPLYDWQRGLLRHRKTEQKTTNMKLPVCSPRWRPKSKVCLLAMVSMLGRLAFCRPVWSNQLVSLWPVFQLTVWRVNHLIQCAMPDYYYYYYRTKSTLWTNKEQIALKNSAVCTSYRATVQSADFFSLISRRAGTLFNSGVQVKNKAYHVTWYGDFYPIPWNRA